MAIELGGCTTACHPFSQVASLASAPSRSRTPPGNKPTAPVPQGVKPGTPPNKAVSTVKAGTWGPLPQSSTVSRPAFLDSYVTLEDCSLPTNQLWPPISVPCLRGRMCGPASLRTSPLDPPLLSAGLPGLQCLSSLSSSWTDGWHLTLQAESRKATVPGSLGHGNESTQLHSVPQKGQGLGRG